MSMRNKIVTFAVVGLIAGTVTYLLMGTEDGKKQLKKAKRQIKKLSDDVVNQSQRGYERASSFAEKAGKDISSLANKAKDYGKDVLDEAEEASRGVRNEANSTAQTIASRAKKV